jgi:chromosome segregation ATPase
MANTTVDLLELCDSDRISLLERTRAYLKQQVEETNSYNSILPIDLEKDNKELELNLPLKVKNEMSTLKNTIEKIRNLQEEKKSLLLEIEELKRMSESKATALESEVSALREEIRSLKTLMTGIEPKPDYRFKK